MTEVTNTPIVIGELRALHSLPFRFNSAELIYFDIMIGSCQTCVETIHEIWSSWPLLAGGNLIKMEGMEASIENLVVNKKLVVVVNLTGRTETESVERFRQACRAVLPGKSIIFNFKSLSFVGSVSLRGFLEAIHSLSQAAETDVRFCALSADFSMVLSATPLRFRPIYSDLDSALASFSFEMPKIETPPTEAIQHEYISLTEEPEI